MDQGMTGLKVIGAFLCVAVLLHGGIYKAIPLQGQGSDVPMFIMNAWTGSVKFCNGYNCYNELHKETVSPTPR